MLRTAVLAGLLMLTGVASGQAEDEALRARVNAVLAEVPLIDGHNDVPWQYRKRVELHLDQLDFAADLGTLEPPMHTDLDRLRAGGVGGQFWSVYIPITLRGGRPGDARVVIEQIDFVKRLASRYADHLEIALTADDVERIHREGRIASLMGMEGGHSIEESMGVLRATYELGARYMTLTHSLNTRWADSATDDPGHDGLTPFGCEIVREMNRVGMIVDLSHVAPSTMHDALDVTRAPVMFSHSSARAVCDHARNVPDDVLRRLPENGGVVMITFLGFYVSEELRLWGEQRDELRRRLVIDHAEDIQAIETAIAAWEKEHPMPEATLGQVADHIDHVRDVAGIDHVGLGGDYDGTSSLPVGLEDVSKYPDLLIELLRRGYSDDDIAKIVGRNILRVMRDVEQTAAQLQQSEPPRDVRIEDMES